MAPALSKPKQKRLSDAEIQELELVANGMPGYIASTMARNTLPRRSSIPMEQISQANDHSSTLEDGFERDFLAERRISLQQPKEDMMRVLMMVTCYSEGESSLRGTLESLAMTGKEIERERERESRTHSTDTIFF
jgi:hypothetical protein